MAQGPLPVPIQRLLPVLASDAGRARADTLIGIQGVDPVQVRKARAAHIGSRSPANPRPRIEKTDDGETLHLTFYRPPTARWTGSSIPYAGPGLNSLDAPVRS
jgi:hypothetical protein